MHTYEYVQFLGRAVCVELPPRCTKEHTHERGYYRDICVMTYYMYVYTILINITSFH